MHTPALVILVLCCELCLTIRVPVDWDNRDSEVNNDEPKTNEEHFSVEQFKPQQTATPTEKPIPVEYFEYTAKKPQFAVDIASFHGVQSPENHYKAYPIRPHTGRKPPELGKHQMLNKGNDFYKPFQEYVNKNEDSSHVTPASTSYEVFHPYDAETPELQAIYKDPVLTKIRNDLHDSKNRLQNYEKEAGEPDITKGEYLESPEETDRKKFPHQNIPARYEIHRPQRRPIYYRPVPIHHSRDHYLNQKLRHPWNQNYKIRPVHYRPIKNHINRLRQNHALKYDDERNEYPQVQQAENYEQPQEGYDIYERGKEKFSQLRNNVDESINRAVQQNRPVSHQNLELQKYEPPNNDDEEDEFVPIKNYAQVRKTETVRHLPKSAALADADTYEEIRNAPRLREAVKSTKAQTVYTEEGYEDAAYDHAGEQKHAVDHEEHGGHLTENEISGGKYKTPSFNAKYKDAKGDIYRDEIVHGEKWNEDNKKAEKDQDQEGYSEDEYEESVEAETYDDKTPNKDNSNRNKRENDEIKDESIENGKINETIVEHDVGKREANFKVPAINLDSTYLTEKEILKLAKIKAEPKKDTIKSKYPYYFKNLKSISQHSPLRYAENLKLIPKKSKGGTEFYDSRSKFECPEVDEVDPVPEKIKQGDNLEADASDENEEESSTKGDENYDTVKKTPRLKGLGDKIDCFKAKYFGENPLDSPFFKEDIISNPEPVTLPNLDSYKLKLKSDIAESKPEIVLAPADNLRGESTSDIFTLLEKLRDNQNSGEDFKLLKDSSQNDTSNNTQLTEQSNVYQDVLDNIKKTFDRPTLQNDNKNITEHLEKSDDLNFNKNYSHFQNKEDVTKQTPTIRKKRSTPFIYEPYKIIRDIQVQDSKKTTTTSNISPLIKQLQTSKVADIVTKTNHEKVNDKHVKRNVNARAYIDIGRQDREKTTGRNDDDSHEPAFVDVSVDKRRGEPRYEIRPANHKSQYTPVENRKSMSIEDYQAQAHNNTTQNRTKGEISRRNSSRQSNQRRPTARPLLDISTFIPRVTDTQTFASSNTVRKTIATTTPVPKPKTEKSIDSSNEEDTNESDSEEDYEEYDDEEEENITTTTTTTTTKKPAIRRRIRITTEKPREIDEIEKPKLKLVTRFRDYNLDNRDVVKQENKEKPVTNVRNINYSTETPKYREKKKKSTTSTIVTDTKKYGDDDEDDMRKEEVDAMIGVKHDMDDYMPLYEKEVKNKNRSESDEESSEDYEDDNHEENESDNNDDDVDDDDKEDDDVDDEESEIEPELTTPEPTKRTLAITTEAPIPTVAVHRAKIETKPIVTRKKIEIHKELPVNKSSPHITQFKHDIKEEEIIKEIPKRPRKKLQKNTEALELFKDDNLAKEINGLGDVEVFKQNLDITSGPKHGGNYRSAVIEESTTTVATPIPIVNLKTTKGDTEASQSENTKNIELDEDVPQVRLHGGNLRSRSNTKTSPRSRGRSSKLIELSDPPNTSMHGGNLRQSRGRTRGRSEKLIELDDEDDESEDSSRNSRGGSSYSSSGHGRPMHGGNYRSAKIVQESTTEANVETRKPSTDARRSSAAVLNSFVQAIPILTSTPAYILDPSKRMYYYVDV